MERIVKDQYGNLTLPEFAEKIKVECYDPIERLCENAGKQIQKLEALELQQSTSNYTSLCKKIIEEISHCLAVRNEQYIPYIKQLGEKADTKHDCSSCTGSCKLNHDVTIVEMKASLSNIKGILYRLQMVSLPLYSETIYPDAYRILRSQMALIENSLTELFVIEDSRLIPKIIEAQKSSNHLFTA